MFIVVGSAITLAIFLFVGWAVSAEMFQQRAWRKRVAEGDVDIVGALIGEAMTYWGKSRIPKGMPANRWAAIQGAELIAVAENEATLSASVVPAYHSEGGRRVKVSSDIEEATALAARLLDLIMYDVPNLRLSYARVDVYASLEEAGDGGVQQPILSSTADRATADELVWEDLSPRELLSRFETTWAEERDGHIIPIDLPPIEGVSPRPAEEAALDAGFDSPRRTT
jgi:hypothetical protein